MAKTNVVVAPNGLPKKALRQAGCFTLWSLSGSVDCHKLTMEWLDSGMPDDQLLELNSPETALRRACREHRNGQRVERLRDGGWCLSGVHDDEDDAGADLRHTTELRVWLLEDETLRFEPPDEARVGVIGVSYVAHQREWNNTDISNWLTRHLDRLRAVPLRRTGGTYYVQPDKRDEWEAIIDIVEGCSAHKIYVAPAFQNEGGTLRLIVDSLTEELVEQSKRMREHVEEKNYGERGLKTKKAELEELEAKLDDYEQLLGVNLEKVREHLGDVDEDIGLALIEAATAKAKAKRGGKQDG